jgi:hypothetical protein
MSRDDLEAVITALVELYWIRTARSISANDLAGQVIASVRAGNVIEPIGGWDAATSRLRKLLGIDGALGTTAKALFIAYQAERHIHECRVITDARPVFEESISAPSAFIVTHTLKVVFHEGGDDGEWFATLDSSDLRSLRKTIDRALEKEQQLVGALKATEIPVLLWEDADGS